jgi:predicted ATP-dependent endonuclease of OLD family
MHIQKVQIRNIKSIKEFDMAFDKNEPLAGWHVLIGDNGSGKSTVLKAISLALIGESSAYGLNEDWESWLPSEEPTMSSSIELNISRHALDKVNLTLRTLDKLRVVFIDPRLIGGKSYRAEPQEMVPLTRDEEENKKEINRNWFSAAYGPYRRFAGRSEEYDRIFKSNLKLAAHLSVFREDAALSEIVGWLLEMRFRDLETLEKHDIAQEKLFLSKLRNFINHDEFLPYKVQINLISSAGVFFKDANGSTVAMQNLSDGYRSILSMTFEIIRQMQIAYQTDDLFSDDFKTIKMPGVVLIDEVDAHLHPTWQRKIGPWFRQHFPDVQFIVTTHSPLICQAVAEGGSVWKLPRPGTDEKCVRVTGQDLNRLLYGNILEAYSTQLFGLTETRSEEGHEKLERLAQLNVKEVFQGLTDEEKQEQAELRATLPTDANTIEANS